MTAWMKYNLVCPNCDTLFEITTTYFNNTPTCVCDYPDELVLLGWEDATVSENNVSNVTPRKVVKIDSNPYN